MTLKDYLDIFQVVASGATAIGLFLTFWQVVLTKRQTITQFEDELTQQYRQIIRDIPIGALLDNVDELDERHCVNDEKFEKLLDDFYHYIDLCNEQVFLRYSGRISEATWKTWCEGIQSNLTRPWFEKAWVKIKDRSIDFVELRLLEQSDYTDDPRNWRKRQFLHEDEVQEYRNKLRQELEKKKRIKQPCVPSDTNVTIKAQREDTQAHQPQKAVNQ